MTLLLTRPVSPRRVNLTSLHHVARIFQVRPTLWVLVAVNVLPLVGVLYFGWKTFDVVFTYWCENVAIGVINVLRMLTCNPDVEQLSDSEVAVADTAESNGPPSPDKIRNLRRRLAQRGPLVGWLEKLFLIPFFCFHYGMFCMGHGAFIFSLLGGPERGEPTNLDQVFGSSRSVLHGPLLLTVGVLAASHLWSFIKNYLWGGEYRRVMLMTIMFRPYGRIVLLHVAILFGGIAAQALGSPIWMLVLLVAGKVLMDAALHVYEHQTLERPVLTTA
ncbi:hypothetical protein Pla111_15600 [Botrimarina hoheduenensis]|uniref:Uncharacterized protein n=2 Tax=Botrimarina hoheduenensis TaxID=2528000 RepID=A0A5C5W781_9BACT|nr:hypothetical protein Pla111_15600 [Botrimarina hoheduenensis]